MSLGIDWATADPVSKNQTQHTKSSKSTWISSVGRNPSVLWSGEHTRKKLHCEGSSRPSLMLRPLCMKCVCSVLCLSLWQSVVRNPHEQWVKSAGCKYFGWKDLRHPLLCSSSLTQATGPRPTGVRGGLSIVPHIFSLYTWFLQNIVTLQEFRP